MDDVVWEHLSEEEMPGLLVIIGLGDLKYIYSQTPEMTRIRDGIFRAFLHPNRLRPEDLNIMRTLPKSLR